jgi:hypothetical protein
MSKVRFAAATIREIEAAREAEFAVEIDRNTQKMKAAEVLGFVSELRDHYPGFALWLVPRPLINQVGCMAAVVRL